MEALLFFFFFFTYQNLLSPRSEITQSDYKLIHTEVLNHFTIQIPSFYYVLRGVCESQKRIQG